MRHEQDPRVVFGRKHRERGPIRFSYTYKDISRLTGVKVNTIRQHVNRGRLDPTRLESVISYVNECRAHLHVGVEEPNI
jgi:hypothetical protein